MIIMDDYRKGWALRYLREAEDELRMSEKVAYSIELILDAARKAQTAIYYVLGDPSSVENLVQEAVGTTENVESPVLRCLIDIERKLEKIESLPLSAGEAAAKEAQEIIKIASGVVSLFAAED